MRLGRAWIPAFALLFALGSMTPVARGAPGPPNVSDFAPRSCYVGCQVTILGTGFTGTTSVKVGGVAWPFAVVSDVQIVVTVPGSGKTGAVVVTTPQGKSTFTVTAAANAALIGRRSGWTPWRRGPAALPNVSNFTPRSCSSGCQVSIVGSGFLGATAVKVGGSKWPAFSVISDTRIVATVPTGAKTGAVVVTTPVGNSTFALIPPPPPTGDTVTVMAAGDICTTLPSSCASTANLIVSAGPDRVLPLGDNQYGSGTLAQYLASYDTQWGRFKSITSPVAGNHEWQTASAQGYLNYFALGGVGYWYAFDLGSWRFIALDGTCAKNGGCGSGSPQYAWLQNELSTPHACTLAYWHQPRWSSGSTHGSDATVAPFWDLLYSGGADLVLNGHEHNYERFAPQNPQGQADPVGIVEIVAGTGGNGNGSYPFGAAKANSQVRLNGLGVVELTLSPTGWSERFLRTSGAVVDQTSGVC